MRRIAVALLSAVGRVVGWSAGILAHLHRRRSRRTEPADVRRRRARIGKSTTRALVNDRNPRRARRGIRRMTQVDVAVRARRILDMNPGMKPSRALELARREN